MTSSRAPIPLTVLLGVPGSGTTPLLGALLRLPEWSRTLVVQTQPGQALLPHPFVTQAVEAAQPAANSGGCPCCGVRQDLVRTLCDITWRFARAGQRLFDQVVVEAAADHDPAPMLHTVLTHALLVPRYRLAGVVTAVTLHALAEPLTPMAQRAIGVADRLLLTATAPASAEAVQQGLARLAQLNPLATVCPADVGGQADATWWRTEPRHSACQTGAASPSASGVADIQVLRWQQTQPCTAAALAHWQAALATQFASQLLQVQGVFTTPAASVRVRAVTHHFLTDVAENSVTPAMQAGVTFMTQGLNAAQQQALQQLCASIGLRPAGDQ